MAPIHPAIEGTALRVCVLVRAQPDPSAGPYVLLRELPGSRVYLGAVCDAEARVQDWVEIWVQNLEMRDLAFSSHQECLTNFAFDKQWLSEYAMFKKGLPDATMVTGMEEKNPAPILIKRHTGKTPPAVAAVEITPWQICKDDQLLDSHGLPRYSTSPYRYLLQPNAEPKTFLATAADAPANSHVQPLERLGGSDGNHIFNPHGGLLRVTRFSPLGLEEYLQVLEGQAWSGIGPGATQLFPRSIYAELRKWSEKPKGMPYLLHGWEHSVSRLNEIFFLKLAALRNIFKEVRNYVQAQQLPMLNLSPASFRVTLPEAGDQFPVLWSTQCSLVKPGQAHPLNIKSTEQKYFIRLGKVEPSPFLPEGLGAHSFGIGSVRLRNVLLESNGIVLEGTLVAEDYLGLDAYDLLWFKLPLGEEKLEFYAHVYTAEAVGPREARFRTVPVKLADAMQARLKSSAGTTFAKSPYEIWPLLSSPCDVYSLGIMAIRFLLANGKSNLPVIVDDVLGLARHLGKDAGDGEKLQPKLKALLEREKGLMDLVSPHALIQREWTPEQARAQIHMDIWLEAIALVLRLFPGAGAHSYCKSFGDVSPIALETVFDHPIQELESLVLRLRSALAPSLSANEEIAGALLEQLAGLK